MTLCWHYSFTDKVSNIVRNYMLTFCYRYSITVLRSISFPTNLPSVLPQSLRHALSCALCLSLRLFYCLPMRGSRPHSAWHIDADGLVSPPCYPVYFCLFLLAYSWLLLLADVVLPIANWWLMTHRLTDSLSDMMTDHDSCLMTDSLIVAYWVACSPSI